MRALEALKAQFKKDPSNPLFKEMLENVEKGDYSINAYLNMYCNNPEDVHGMNYAQARLLLTDDILLNPISGVKIFRYNDIENAVMDKYEDKLDEIIKKIVATKK